MRAILFADLSVKKIFFTPMNGLIILNFPTTGGRLAILDPHRCSLIDVEVLHSRKEMQ